MTLGVTHDELVIDGFAGGGGASEGMEDALGYPPDLAYNHDAPALAMHRANHPSTKHVCRNIMRVDPLAEVGTRPVGLAWFSPDCKHHSKAKGGKPVKRAIRDLAWVVVLWAKRARPRVIILENVEEYRQWGPLIARANGDWYPDPARLGQTFDRWVGELRRLGYKVEWRELRACDYGAPTIRKRLFVIARRDGLPIVWPAPTHGDPKSEGVKSGRLKPWRTAAEIIDWSRVCHSIFLTREEGRAVGVNRPLADATMARIAKGVKRYVIDAARPFIVPITHQGDSRVHGTDDPLRTVTTAPRGEHALVTPTFERALLPEGEGASRSEADEGDDSAAAAFITKFREGDGGRSLDVPAPTVTANSFDKRPGGAAPIGLVTPFLTPVKTQGGGGNDPRALDRPGRTTTASKRGEHALVAPYLVPRYGERPGQEPRTRSLEDPAPTAVPDANGGSLAAVHLTKFSENSTGSNADDPLHAVMPGAQRHGIVAAAIVKNNFGDKPMYGLDDPTHTIVAGGTHHALVSAHLNAYYGEGEGGADRSAPAEEPARTVVTENRHALVSAFLAQHNTDVVGHAAEEPVSTIVQKGCTQAVVETSFLSRQHTSNTAGGEGALDRPTQAVMAGGTHAAEVRAFLTKYYGSAVGQDAGDPLHAATAKARFGVVTVTIDGEPYVIVDIGMRMLTPRELFRAQGFPDSYIIDRGLDHDGEWMPLTKTAQVRMCGNSVCPPLAAALVRANYADGQAERTPRRRPADAPLLEAAE